MQHMAEKLGAWQTSGGEDSGKVQFRLFFPDGATGLQHNIQTIQVCGDFQTGLGQPKNWDSDTAPMLVKELAKAPTVYLSNHDHSHVAWQAGARNNMGALQWYCTQPYAIALMTVPGTPMVQNGQESPLFACIEKSSC